MLALVGVCMCLYVNKALSDSFEANRTENLFQGINIVRHHSHHWALWFVSVLSN